MNFPQIKMESVLGKLVTTTTNALVTIEQPPADLKISQPKAELDIRSIEGKLTIDQTKAWEDMDLKHIFRRIEEYAQNGFQDWLAGMARVSQEGDDMMRIENGGDPIPTQAKINSESPMYDFNVGFVPSHFSVKINYQPSHLKFNWKTNKPEIDVKINRPHIEYTAGRVRGEIEQWPSLKIEVSI
jgi:hypothetical protein